MRTDRKPQLTKRDWVLLNSALALYAYDLDDEEWGDQDNAMVSALRRKIQARITQADINRGWHRDTGTCSLCAARVPDVQLERGLCPDCQERRREGDED